MISDFVLELLETLDVNQSQSKELVANMETIETLKKPEELMV